MAVVVQVSQPYSDSRAALSFGQFVTAAIQGRKFLDIAVLPATVLRDGDLVYVLDGGKLFARKVTVLWSSRKKIAISSGLKMCERVCASSLDSFEEGMEVTAIQKDSNE